MVVVFWFIVDVCGCNSVGVRLFSVLMLVFVCLLLCFVFVCLDGLDHANFNCYSLLFA